MTKFYLKQLFEEPETEAKGVDDKPEGQDNHAADKAEKKYTEDELSEIVQRRLARQKAADQKKLDEAAKLAEKQLDEAAKLAEMTAMEKAEHRLDAMQKEIESLKREKTLNDMGKTARQILSESDITLNDSLIEMLITEDAEQTKENLTMFTESFKSAVQAELKKQLSGKTPKTGGEKPEMTKEEILKIKDPVKRRQAISENLELFNKRK